MGQWAGLLYSCGSLGGMTNDEGVWNVSNVANALTCYANLRSCSTTSIGVLYLGERKKDMIQESGGWSSRLDSRYGPWSHIKNDKA